MRRLLLALTLTLVAAAPALAAPAKPAGFKVTLSDGQKVECAYLGVVKKLQCLNYTRVVDQPCDAGGAVFATELAAKGKPTDTFFCVDEGFHDWKVLRRGASWKSGPLSCRLAKTGKTLRCKNKTGTYTIAKQGDAA